jgi:hypothetical protein
MDIERGSPSGGALPGLSEEFNVIVTLAQELARNRDNQEVSVDDLLTALDRLPADSSAAQLIRGERKNGASALDPERALIELSLAIDQQFQEVRRQVEMLRLDLPGDDFGRLKRYLEERDGALEQLIRSGFADVVSRLAPTVPEATEPLPQPGATPPRGPDEDSLWERIFGRKPAEVSAPAVGPSPVQTRWGI